MKEATRLIVSRLGGGDAVGEFQEQGRSAGAAVDCLVARIGSARGGYRQPRGAAARAYQAELRLGVPCIDGHRVGNGGIGREEHVQQHAFPERHGLLERDSVGDPS